MEDKGTPVAVPTENLETPTMSFLQRLIGIYTQPKNTFEDINRKRSWVGMYLIMAALAIAAVYVPTTRMDHETYMRKALKMNPFSRNLSEEQIKPIIERPQSQLQRYSSLVLAPIGPLLGFLISAAVLLLVFVLMGGALNFKRSFTMTIWGMAPPGLVAGLLGILLMYIKDPDSLEIDPASNVMGNLGLLVSQKEQPVLSSLLSSIDLFSFWTIFLLSLGFYIAANGKLSRGKATVGVLIPWAMWVLGKAGFAAIFS